MSTNNEDKFREAIKGLVRDEPEKLSFYDGLESPSEIRPFSPATSGRHGGTIPKPASVRRRSYQFGMAAAAACFVVFLTVAAVDSVPRLGGGSAESLSFNNSSAISGGDMGGAEAPSPAPARAPAPDLAPAPEVSQEPGGAPSPAEPPVDGGDGAVAGGGAVPGETDGIQEDRTGQETEEPDMDDSLFSSAAPVESAPSAGGGSVYAAYDAATDETDGRTPLVYLACALAAAALFAFFYLKRRKQS